MELKETVEMMQSDDYKERFIAEYNQVKIRHAKLKKFIMKLEIDRDNGVAKNKHDCPRSLLHEQLKVMQDYLDILEERALYENIEL